MVMAEAGRQLSPRLLQIPGFSRLPTEPFGTPEAEQVFTQPRPRQP
jgi:hypothetical protein